MVTTVPGGSTGPIGGVSPRTEEPREGEANKGTLKSSKALPLTNLCSSSGGEEFEAFDLGGGVDTAGSGAERCVVLPEGSMTPSVT